MYELTGANGMLLHGQPLFIMFITNCRPPTDYQNDFFSKYGVMTYRRKSTNVKILKGNV